MACNPCPTGNPFNICPPKEEPCIYRIQKVKPKHKPCHVKPAVPKCAVPNKVPCPYGAESLLKEQKCHQVEFVVLKDPLCFPSQSPCATCPAPALGSLCPPCAPCVPCSPCLPVPPVPGSPAGCGSDQLVAVTRQLFQTTPAPTTAAIQQWIGIANAYILCRTDAGFATAADVIAVQAAVTYLNVSSNAFDPQGRLLLQAAYAAVVTATPPDPLPCTPYPVCY